MFTANKSELPYSEDVLARFRQPRFAGCLDDANPGVVAGFAKDPATGHVVRMWLEINGSTINKARFKALGCPVTIAAASLAAETIEGKSLQAAASLRGKMLVESLQAPVEKTSCGLLVEDAMSDALKSLLQPR